MARLLIVEDDLTFATMISTWLAKKGFGVEKAGRVSAARKAIADSREAFDLVLSDLRLPDQDGLELLEWMRGKGQSTPFIVMTSYAEVQNAVRAMKMGATDYIAKPVQPDILLQKIKDALAAPRTQVMPVANAGRPEGAPAVTSGRTKAAPAEKSEKKKVPRYLEGESPASRKLYDYVSLVAPTPMSVLILGASGTGKEYVARRIHELSPRASRPFFALDCGAIPKDVAASEFFGYKKGAFTGADSDKEGAFVAAQGGTLFLDEVGNLSYDVQVQLLRAIQERKVRPLGSATEIDVDIRLVCATNENLSARVAEGLFREDLYHRISEFTIRMPELRERGADLLRFARLFLAQANEELGRNVEDFTPEAVQMLTSYSWPGNLRELNNVVKRATLLTRGTHTGAVELSQAMDISTQLSGPSTSLHSSSSPLAPKPLRDASDERRRIEEALRQTAGNKARAARLLGIDRKTLYNKIEKYNIE